MSKNQIIIGVDPVLQRVMDDAVEEEPAACSMCGHTRYLRICVDRSCLCRCYTADDEEWR